MIGNVNQGIYNNKLIGLYYQESALKMFQSMNTSKSDNLFPMMQIDQLDLSDNGSLSSEFDINTEKLSYYFANKKDGQKLLDTINFTKAPVSTGYLGSMNFKVFQFGTDEDGQCIPFNKVPRINTSSLDRLAAKDNNLVLKDDSYYSYKGKDGKSYAWAFSDGYIGRAFSEQVLNDDVNTVSAGTREDMDQTASVLSYMANGMGGEITRYTNSQIKESLNAVGITSGRFSVGTSDKSYTYYMGEKGEIFDENKIKETITSYNETDFKKAGYEQGDKVTVFGKEYTVDETGHIKVPDENYWENETCTELK